MPAVRAEGHTAQAGAVAPEVTLDRAGAGVPDDQAAGEEGMSDLARVLTRFRQKKLITALTGCWYLLKISLIRRTALTGSVTADKAHVIVKISTSSPTHAH